MARLTIEQVQAPDFSASSEMMARANESFNSGMESAKGILSKYNEGQQAKGDAALLGQLAGLDSEEALNNFLATTDLSTMNLSDKMRENILGARTAILGNDSTRQGTMNARDANSRANAGEGRVAAEYADGVAARDELRGLTPAYTAAYTEGHQYGNGAAPAGGSTRDILAKTLMAEAGNQGYDGMMAVGSVIRNRADNGHYGGNTIDGVIMQPGQFSAWNGVTGYANGEQGQDMAHLQPSENAYKAADQILSGQYTDSTGGATHYYNPDVSTPGWGQGSNPSGDSRGWTRIGAHIFGNPDGPAAPGSGPRTSIDGGPITSNASQGPAGAAFADALARSTYMTPDQARGFLDDQFANQAAGQSLIDTAEAKRQTEVGAAATLAAIQSPNNLTGDAVTADLMNTPGMSASNILAMAGQDRSQFAGVIAPTPRADTEVADALARTGAVDAANGANDPIARSFAMAESLDASGDVGAGVLDGMTIGEGVTPDSAYVSRRLTEQADRLGVSPGELATSLRNASDGNFSDFMNMLDAPADTDLADTVASIVDRDFGDNAKAAYQSSQSDASARVAERNSMDLQYSTLRSQAMKESDPARRSALMDQAGEIRATIIAGMTASEREQNLRDYVSKTGMGSRLQGLDPNSADFFRAMAQLEETIKMDSTLTDQEKELLLRDVRG